MAGEIPVRLDSPPDGSAPNPPLMTLAQGLPFTGLTWQNFERLILRLVRSESSITDCEIYGTPGQAQSGIDILGTAKADASKKVCYQCKKVESFKASDIKKAVDKFLNGIWCSQAIEFVLCTTCSLETTEHVKEISIQRSRLQKKSITFTIWDGSESGNLSEKLKELPELVDDFFGRPWVKAFNGDEEAVRLGEKLDTVDFGNLRTRLKSLYTVLFNQHDPGLRMPIGHAPDYLHRYVLADIFTVANVDSTLTEQSSKPQLTAIQPNQSTEEGSGELLPISTASNTYEARRGVFGWLNEQKNCVVLGEAGYGKSALLRHLALAMLRQEEALRGHLEASKLQLLPVWMSFPAFSAAIERKHTTSVEDHFKEWLHQNSFDDVKDIFERSLRTSKLLLLVDGLDEATSQRQAQLALDRIVAFAEGAEAEVICTSRPLGFSSLGVPTSWTNANLAALSDQQICEFSSRWLALTEGENSEVQLFEEARQRAQGRAEIFLGAVRANARTHQLARIPLLCQTLIELFRTNPRLPDERQAIYSQIIELLLTSHPDARARAAGTAITVESLGLNLRDIREILIRLAWDMQYEGRVVVESAKHLESVCAGYLMDEDEGLGLSRVEARTRAHSIINALLTQFGVLVEKAPSELGFVHLSIQEFLAAEAVCRKSEEDQLGWISEIWMQPRWRECLINWFGIQGARGKKVFIGSAANRIFDHGNAGEYERMQALQIRATLVCADLGFPINEARKVIQEIIGDLEHSPFQQHRVALAKELTIGALSHGVREECSAFINKFATGRSSYQRASIISAFQTWKPADDLQSTLLKGICDEEFFCRRAAATSLSKVFMESSDLREILVDMAMHELRPEVRASALRTLGLNKNWAVQALECAQANLTSNFPELIFEAIKIRIVNKQLKDSDRDLMLRMMANETINYWQVEEFYDFLFEGWSQDHEIKETILAAVQYGSSWSSEDQGQLKFLLRAYPGDEVVADILADRFKTQRMHFTGDPAKLWPLISTSFRNHPKLVPILRELLDEYRQEYKVLIWHPDSIGIFMAIGDDSARDELIHSYETIDDPDGIDKYWIANTLIVGWPQDEHLKQTFIRWSKSNIELATPLAAYSASLFEDEKKRRTWLEDIAKNAKNRVVQWAYYELLDQFPDKATCELISNCETQVKFWHYNRVNIEAKIAAILPSEAASQIIFERSLSDPEGPPIGQWAASVENIPKFRSEVLTVCAPTPVAVRTVIMSTLRDRIADYNTLLRLAPRYLTEENSPVRSTTLLALAQSARSDEVNRTDLEAILVSELSALGAIHDSRKISAIAGLLELGSASLITHHYAAESSQPNWIRLLFAAHQPDPVALNAIIKHWEELLPMLEKHGLSTKFPLNEIISSSYGNLLEQSPSLKKEIDGVLLSGAPHWDGDEPFIELLSRKFPKTDLLRITLTQVLEAGYHSPQTIRKVMRLLAYHFKNDVTTLKHIINALANYKTTQQPIPDGCLGYLATGWKDSTSIVNSYLPADINSLGYKDKLLIFSARGERESAEQCALEFFKEPFADWRYANEDTNCIREWAADTSSMDTLTTWAESDNSNLSMTAISVLNEQGKISTKLLNQLYVCFNRQFTEKTTPADGIDAIFRNRRGWCITAYPAIIAGFES